MRTIDINTNYYNRTFKSAGAFFYGKLEEGIKQWDKLTLREVDNNGKVLSTEKVKVNQVMTAESFNELHENHYGFGYFIPTQKFDWERAEWRNLDMFGSTKMNEGWVIVNFER